MDRTVVGLIGTVAALSAPLASQAASPAPQSIEAVMQASSYADLLKPIPDALAIVEAAAVAEPAPSASSEPADPAVVLAQYHHHHHHYRRYHRRFYHHHHHHHDHA